MSVTVAQLNAAVEGLLYPSESDEPFSVLTWPALPKQTPRQAVEAHTDGKQPVVEQAVDEFFADLAETDDAERYAALHRQLSELSTLTVLRVGRVRVDVYLIGRLASDWIVLKTLSIET